MDITNRRSLERSAPLVMILGNALLPSTISLWPLSTKFDNKGFMGLLVVDNAIVIHRGLFPGKQVG